MPFIDFTTGQVLTADQMDLVMRQTVMRFADASTRDTALTGVLAEGMIAYLDDTNEVIKYNGTAWVNVAPTPDPSPDDIITTQGDLIIGDATGDAVRLPVGAADTVLTSDGTTVSFAAAGGGGGFDSIDEVTASNATFDVSGITGFARFTLIGGGGGGAAGGTDGGAGGSTSVVIGGVTVTANGGAGGKDGVIQDPLAFANASSNGGPGRNDGGANDGGNGQGGKVVVSYQDLTGVSTVNITIGAAGSAPTGNGASVGFRGVVLLEFTS